MIAHEVDMEKMRRREGVGEAAETKTPNLPEVSKVKKNEENMRSIEELTKKLTAKEIQVTKISLQLSSYSVNI